MVLVGQPRRPSMKNFFGIAVPFVRQPASILGEGKGYSSMKSWLSLRNPFSKTAPVQDSPSGDLVAMGPAASAEASDDELLRKFVVERDDRAFGLLVERHSGMVMGVCRRVLGFQHDAEDAFQAAFLVLARKANTLRCGGSLPAWLHKTAFRTALRARADRGRRRE